MEALVLFDAQGSCVLIQGEPGYGIKGEKGDTGASGPKVSDWDFIFGAEAAKFAC